MISVYLSLGSVITFTKITTVMIKDLNKLCTLTKKVTWYCGKEVESFRETGWILCNDLNGVMDRMGGQSCLIRQPV